MKATEAIRKIMESTGVRFSVLMDRVGIAGNTLANRLNLPNISVGKLNELAKALDYKIVLVPRDMEVGKDCYKIE